MPVLKKLNSAFLIGLNLSKSSKAFSYPSCLIACLLAYLGHSLFAGHRSSTKQTPSVIPLLPARGGGGESHIKLTEIIVGNFERNP